MNSKYVIYFEKSGYIKYTSHLDMMRLFKRIIRKTGIKLAYSQGFNPHPKMSLALPLSLGYTGKNEILEIETAEEYDTVYIAKMLNDSLPEGIKIITVGTIDRPEENQRNRTIASQVYAADYMIEVPLGSAEFADISECAKRFSAQPSLITQKVQKKTGKMLDTDIKPLINSIFAEINNGKIIITANIAQGSQSTLSPELLLTEFCKFINLEFDRSEVEMTRLKIYF